MQFPIRGFDHERGPRNGVYPAGGRQLAGKRQHIEVASGIRDLDLKGDTDGRDLR